MSFYKTTLCALSLAAVFFYGGTFVHGEGPGDDPTAPAETPAEATSTPEGPTRDELETQIKEKSQALEQVNKSLLQTETNLQKTKSQSSSLRRELQTLQYTVNQLELNIQADQIANQKLALEIESLGYDIRDIEISLRNKKETIAYLLRELQKRDNTNLLVTLLRHDSLADGVLESQSLLNLRSQISIDISTLEGLHKIMNEKVSKVADKKREVEAHQKNLTNRKAITQDKKEERTVILAQTKNQEAAYAKQLEELKKQQEAISKEIDEIEDQLRKNFDVGLLPSSRPGALSWPVRLGGSVRITQHFGERSRLYGGRPHNGLDIGAPVGTPVYAADDGVVMAVDNNDRSKWNKYQYGRYVLIRHANNLATLYAHLSRQEVQRGEQVKRGDLIGYSGNTGYSTGSHLHFGVYWAPSILMKSIPPAAGLVPVGVIISPEEYL